MSLLRQHEQTIMHYIKYGQKKKTELHIMGRTKLMENYTTVWHNQYTSKDYLCTNTDISPQRHSPNLQYDLHDMFVYEV